MANQNSATRVGAKKPTVKEIVDRDGVAYTVRSDDMLGKGGQAPVFRAVRKCDKKTFAYKIYKKGSPQVLKNLEHLVNIEKKGGLKDSNGKRIDIAVLPLAIVDRPEGGFGYIMNLVDLKQYTSIKKCWSDPQNFPTAEAVCKIAKNFAIFFHALHIVNGLCYKDVNEGNVFYHPRTGDVRIIDNDNIGPSDNVTIKGTPGYMAPEVVLGDAPSSFSDLFSYAVFLYRIMVGGFPFEGPYTEAYCNKHDVLLNEPETAKELFGKHPLYAWHPTDTRNSPANAAGKNMMYAAQTKTWKTIPTEIKSLFEKTFVTNLSPDRRAERTSDGEWASTFNRLERNLVVCPHCRQRVFAGTELCFNCQGKLAPVPTATVTFKVRTVESNGSVNDSTLKCATGKSFDGAQISRALQNKKWFDLVVDPTGQVRIKNVSGDVWLVKDGNSPAFNLRTDRAIGLKTGMVIALVSKKVNLVVTAINK